MPHPQAVECQGPPCGSSQNPCCQPAPPIVLSSVSPLPQHTKWHPWQVPPCSTSVPPQAVLLISDPNLGSPLRACLVSRLLPGLIPRDFAPSPAGGQAVTQSPGLAQISASQSRFSPLMISISSAELPGTKAALATGQFIKSQPSPGTGHQYTWEREARPGRQGGYLRAPRQYLDRGGRNGVPRQACRTPVPPDPQHPTPTQPPCHLPAYPPTSLCQALCWAPKVRDSQY